MSLHYWAKLKEKEVSIKSTEQTQRWQKKGNNKITSNTNDRDTKYALEIISKVNAVFWKEANGISKPLVRLINKT